MSNNLDLTWSKNANKKSKITIKLNKTDSILKKKNQPFTPNSGKRRKQKKQNFYEINSSKLQLNSTLYLYLSYELHVGCYNIQIWKVKIMGINNLACFTCSNNFTVKFPVPGPISKTVSVERKPACNKKKGSHKNSSMKQAAALHVCFILTLFCGILCTQQKLMMSE